MKLFAAWRSGTVEPALASRWRNIAFLPVALLLAIGLLAPAILSLLGKDAFRPDMLAAMAPPSATHWLGTDSIGRDMFSRVLLATRLDLAIALAAVVLSALPGIVIGASAAILGGRIDRLLHRVVDAAMAFPLFVVALALAAVFGNSLLSVILATALINMPFYIRLSRAEIAVRLQQPYIAAARLSGWSEWRILWRSLLPNIAPSLTVHMSINAGWAMLNGAGLSFLGLGIRPPATEWGVLVGDGAAYILTGQWWLALFPGMALSLAVWSFTLAGDALRDRFDPQRRGQR